MSDGLLPPRTVSDGSATMGKGHSFSASPRWGQCDTLFSLAIRSPVSDKNGAGWIAHRHERMSNGVINTCILP